MVVKFQLCAPLFSLSQLNATAKFSQVFMLTRNLKPYSEFFLVFCFRKLGSFENIKTKAMVLVIAKMNMKVHFNF